MTRSGGEAERGGWRLRVLVRRIVEEELRRALAQLMTAPRVAPKASCFECAAVLVGKRHHAKYCSNRCRVRACRARRRAEHPAQAA